MKNFSVHLLTSLSLLVFVGITVLLISSPSPIFEYAYFAGITLFLGWLLVMWYKIIFGWVTSYMEKRQSNQN